MQNGESWNRGLGLLDLIIARIEAVRHCRWVDEVFSEAPWVIDEQFINEHQIDYVAHDEEPYLSGGHDDVYSLCKRLGMSHFFCINLSLTWSCRQIYSNTTYTWCFYF